MKKINVFAIMMLVLAAGTAYAGLISHYEFQGGFLNSVVGGGDGTAKVGAATICIDPNDTPYSQTDPTICRADLTGGKWVHVGYPGLLFNTQTTQQLTMAVWIKTTQSTYAQLFGRRYDWRLYIQGKPTFGALNGTNSLLLTGTKNINDGLWHHIAATYSGTTGVAKLYIDGQLDASLTQTSPLVSIVSSNRCAIAGIASSTTAVTSVYDGYMDDLRTYDEVLSDAQIQQLFEFTSEPFCLNNLSMDFSGNCAVNFADLLTFAEKWVSEVYLADFAVLGEEWNICGYLNAEDCE